MPESYKGQTVPLYVDVADGPLSFRALVDSGPIPRFASTATRNAAIPSPVRGQVVWRNDLPGFGNFNGGLEVFGAGSGAGSGWRSLIPAAPPSHNHSGTAINVVNSLHGNRIVNDTIVVSGTNDKLVGVIATGHMPPVVYKNVTTEQDLDGPLRVPNGTFSVPSLQFGVQDLGFYRTSGGALGFALGNAQHWEFNNNQGGNFGTPGMTLDVADYDVPKVGFNRVQHRFVAIAADGQAGIFGRNTNGGVVDFRRTGAQVGTITVTPTSTSYNSLSDQRAKENVQDLSPTEAWSKIMALKPRTFTWKADSSKGIGLISQEASGVYDEPVYIPEDPDEMQAIDYSPIHGSHHRRRPRFEPTAR